MVSNTISYGFLETSSIKTIIGESTSVMVYGFTHCLYSRLGEALRDYRIGWQRGLTVIKYNYDFSDDEERLFKAHKIKHDSNSPDSKRCKITLTNVIMENYRRVLEAEKTNENPNIIPIIFCIDISKNEHPFNVNNVLSKNQTFNELITHKEIRRCYKLYADFIGRDDVNLRKFGEVAQQSFKFVKLEKIEGGCNRLEKISPPWESNEWKRAWSWRKSTIFQAPKIIKKLFNPPSKDWRTEIIDWIKTTYGSESSVANNMNQENGD